MRYHSKALWRLFAVTFALSVAGAAVLLNPTLEFAAVDLLEKFHLPVGALGQFAFYAEVCLLLTSTIGPLSLSIRALMRRR